MVVVEVGGIFLHIYAERNFPQPTSLLQRVVILQVSVCKPVCVCLHVHVCVFITYLSAVVIIGGSHLM